jgi:hypothetical protein
MNTYFFKEGPITELSWGKFVIFGKEHYKKSNGSIVGAGKDIRIYKGVVTPWKERKGHYLTLDMITGVNECDILIIGNGILGAVEISKEIKEHYKNLIVKKTPEACKLFNKFYNENKNVALLAHGTC